MKFSLFGGSFLKSILKMFDAMSGSDNEKMDTIQDTALKLAAEQLQLLQAESGPKERTIFILGSKGVGKSTVVNKFFDRDEPLRPTLALEYSFGRRSASTQHNQKQILNFWELGSLDNSEQLLGVPLRTHGLENFAAIIMLDLSQPQRVWLDLEHAYKSLRETAMKIIEKTGTAKEFYERAVERVKREHVDLATLELMPFPVIIVGGKYDLFMNLDGTTKQHIGSCLRSFAHLIGGSLLYYSSKIPKLAKILRDTISHLGFGSPANPFRSYTTNYEDALSIWFGADAWARISESGALSFERIGASLASDIPQIQLAVQQTGNIANPAKDAGFRESIIDEMRAQKDVELQTMLKDAELRGKFETIIT